MFNKLLRWSRPFLGTASRRDGEMIESTNAPSQGEQDIMERGVSTFTLPTNNTLLESHPTTLDHGSESSEYAPSVPTMSTILKALDDLKELLSSDNKDGEASDLSTALQNLLATEVNANDAAALKDFIVTAATDLIAANKQNAALSSQLHHSQRTSAHNKRKASLLQTRLRNAIATKDAQTTRLQNSLETRLQITTAAKNADIAGLTEQKHALELRLQESNQAKDAEIAGLQQKLDDSRHAHQKLSTQHYIQLGDFVDLYHDYADLNNDFQSLIRDFADLNNNFQSLHSDFQRLHSDYQSRTDEVLNLLDTQRMLATRLLDADTKQREANLKAENERLRAELRAMEWKEEAEHELAEVTEERDMAVSERDMALAECDRFIAELQEAGKYAKTLQVELLDAGRQAQELEEELLEARKMVERGSEAEGAVKEASKTVLLKCYELKKEVDVAEAEKGLLREVVGEEEAARIVRRARVFPSRGDISSADELESFKFSPSDEECDEFQEVVAPRKVTVAVIAVDE